MLDVKVFTLPHHSFASDEYLLGAGLLKNSVMDGAAGTPAVEVARLLQQVYFVFRRYPEKGTAVAFGYRVAQYGRHRAPGV